jgi:hypothetical protein
MIFALSLDFRPEASACHKTGFDVLLNQRYMVKGLLVFDKPLHWWQISLAYATTKWQCHLAYVLSNRYNDNLLSCVLIQDIDTPCRPARHTPLQSRVKHYWRTIERNSTAIVILSLNLLGDM